MNEITIIPDWLQLLADDLRAIIVEAEFNSRWELIVGYHQVGKTIELDENYQRYSRGNGKILQSLANCIGRSPRSIYYAIQLYKTFPDLQKLPDGKNISMNKIITKYLPKPNGEVGNDIEPCICPRCGREHARQR